MMILKNTFTDNYKHYFFENPRSQNSNLNPALLNLIFFKKWKFFKTSGHFDTIMLFI